MRVFAVSDIHVDYAENHRWVMDLSTSEFATDTLLLAGDVTPDLALLAEVLGHLRQCFAHVFFVPGNHDLWVRDAEYDCSLQKFAAIERLCGELDVAMTPRHLSGLSIVPMLAWYDFSFGKPDRYLRRAWRDFRACNWPAELEDEQAITRHFLAMNEAHLDMANDCLISFSHFLPRLDVMPAQIPEHRRRVYPVLGSDQLGRQVERLRPDIHVYGHSHVNQSVRLDGTCFINNAFAYPDEERIARKQLVCVWESGQGEIC